MTLLPDRTFDVRGIQAAKHSLFRIPDAPPEHGLGLIRVDASAGRTFNIGGIQATIFLLRILAIVPNFRFSLPNIAFFFLDF